MDKVVIMGEGRIIFDGEFDRAEAHEEMRKNQQQQKSAAETVHQILSSGRVSCARLSSLEMFKQFLERDKDGDISTIGNERKHPMTWLWQVRPLLERQHAECPPTKQDILVLPTVFLIVSLWSIFDSENPVQGERNSFM